MGLRRRLEIVQLLAVASEPAGGGNACRATGLYVLPLAKQGWAVPVGNTAVASRAGLFGWPTPRWGLLSFDATSGARAVRPGPEGGIWCPSITIGGCARMRLSGVDFEKMMYWELPGRASLAICRRISLARYLSRGRGRNHFAGTRWSVQGVPMAPPRLIEKKSPHRCEQWGQKTFWCRQLPGSGLPAGSEILYDNWTRNPSLPNP